MPLRARRDDTQPSDVAIVVDDARRVPGLRREEVAPEATAELQQQFHYYVWDEHTSEVRWMCAWDTAESDVDALAAAIRERRRLAVAEDGNAPPALLWSGPDGCARPLSTDGPNLAPEA